MPLVLADRVRETTTTAGTGTVTLAGAVTGYQTFAAVGNGNTTYYCIAGQGTSEWEVGIGTYTSSGTTLSRDTVLASSAGGAKVTFSAGTKDVFVTYPSGKSINEDASDNVGIGTTTPAAKLDIASGNLLFSSTAQRITGDFSNATLANRLSFQNNVTDGNTVIQALPNGTSLTSGINFFNSSTPTNCGQLNAFINGSEVRLSSSIQGTGTYLPMTFYTGGSERMRIDTSGNVGVGTSTINALVQLKNNVGTAGAANQIRLYEAGASIFGFGVSAGQLDYRGSAHVFYSDTATERMRIDSSGNVGISTGNLSFSGTAQRITGDMSNATQSNRLAFQSNVTNGASVLLLIPNGTSQSATYISCNSSDPNNAARFRATVDASTVNIQSDTTGTGVALPLTLWTSGSERMRIDTSGNVGVGTASPSTYGKLNVNGNIVFGGPATRNQAISQAIGVWTTGDPADDARAAITFNTVAGAASSSSNIVFSTNNYGVSGGERMRIDSSGNVGIGTASPSVRLQATNTSGEVFRLTNTTATERLHFYTRNAAGTSRVESQNSDLQLFAADAFPVTFGTTNTERMRIDTSGRVGIGRTPSVTLDVNGPIWSRYTAAVGYAQLYMPGGYSQFGKDSGQRTDILNTGGLDSTSPFWTGYQWCPPDVITNSGGAASFPRTSFYFNYSTVTNPSNMAFNMYVGNNNGIPIGINIGTESAGNINFITSGSTRLTVTSGGNLNFPGTAQRITGDFSNATRNSRVLFQTTTANDATSVGAIPNGTSNAANFGISNSSNPDNAAVCVMSISGSTAGLNSSKIGTGTTLPLVLSVDSVMRLQFNTDGTINSFDSAAAVGYKGVPLNEQAAAYTLVLADQGKTIVHPITDNNARTYTIPANGTVAFPIGTAITFINMINTVTISITTDTMYLAGVGTTGNRTLAAFGMATAVKITSTSWIISGNGLS